jgi:DNA-binding transcriptional regulator YiaG
VTRRELGRVLACDARALRKRCGISGVTIARGIGVHPSQISSWESGQRRPAGPAGIRYARVIRALADHDAITAELELAALPVAAMEAAL